MADLRVIQGDDNPLVVAHHFAQKLRDHMESGDRAEAVRAAREVFLLARSESAIRAQTLQAKAIEALTARVKELPPQMQIRIVEAISKATENDMIVGLGGVPGGGRGGVSIVQHLGSMTQQGPRSAQLSGSPFKDLGTLMEAMTHISDHLKQTQLIDVSPVPNE